MFNVFICSIQKLRQTAVMELIWHFYRTT